MIDAAVFWAATGLNAFARVGSGTFPTTWLIVFGGVVAGSVVAGSVVAGSVVAGSVVAGSVGIVAGLAMVAGCCVVEVVVVVVVVEVVEDVVGGCVVDVVDVGEVVGADAVAACGAGSVVDEMAASIDVGPMFPARAVVHPARIPATTKSATVRAPRLLDRCPLLFTPPQRYAVSRLGTRHPTFKSDHGIPFPKSPSRSTQ